VLCQGAQADERLCTMAGRGGRWTPTILSIGRADRLVLNEGFFFDKGRKLKIEQVERQ
jgi:hypothetical protein